MAKPASHLIEAGVVAVASGLAARPLGTTIGGVFGTGRPAVAGAIAAAIGMTAIAFSGESHLIRFAGLGLLASGASILATNGSLLSSGTSTGSSVLSATKGAFAAPPEAIVGIGGPSPALEPITHSIDLIDEAGAIWRRDPSGNMTLIRTAPTAHVVSSWQQRDPRSRKNNRAPEPARWNGKYQR